jgi:hypothetical protein
MLLVDIPYLDPDHQRASWGASRVPGDLEQSLAEEEHRPRMIRRAEFPVHGQAQDVPVEAEAAVQVAGAHENPAAQNVHVIIPPSPWVTRETSQSARSAAVISSPDLGVFAVAAAGALCAFPGVVGALP